MSFRVASFHHGRNDYDMRDHVSKNAHIVYSFFPPDFVRFQRRDVCIWVGVARHSYPSPVLKKCVDILMPLMDGYEFVEKLRLLPDYADAPVLMVTGKRIQEGAERRRLDALNTIQVFEKPVNETEIITVLDSVCPQENQ